jgi:hypothetical protein
MSSLPHAGVAREALLLMRGQQQPHEPGGLLEQLGAIVDGEGKDSPEQDFAGQGR